MDTFALNIITQKPKIILDMQAHIGSITIGDFTELFYMPVTSWNLKAYKQQWRDGIARMKTHDISCLVTTIQYMPYNPLIIMWVLYKEETTIFFQQHLVNHAIIEYDSNRFPSIYEFTIDNCYEYIFTPRQTITEEGETISQWSIHRDDFFAS